LSVVTTDALVEDVHFTRAAMSAADIGHRALASNLSDIAAMGAKPVLATVALGFPPETGEGWVRELYAGMTALARASQTAIVGGDLVRSPVVSIAITVVGEVRTTNMKRRSGARAGDVLALTGLLGASRAGLAIALERPDLAGLPEAAAAGSAWRRPVPRLAEGRWLGASRSVHAMMDTSDGLSTDLGRLASASSVAACVDAIPVAPSASAVAAAVGADAESYALDGGEDFELLVAIERRAYGYLAERFEKRFRKPLVVLGRVEAGSGVRLDTGGGSRQLAMHGFDHFRPAGNPPPDSVTNAESRS